MPPEVIVVEQGVITFILGNNVLYNLDRSIVIAKCAEWGGYKTEISEWVLGPESILLGKRKDGTNTYDAYIVNPEN